jgi:hypothetical protein
MVVGLGEIEALASHSSTTPAVNRQHDVGVAAPSPRPSIRRTQAAVRRRNPLRDLLSLG